METNLPAPPEKAPTTLNAWMEQRLFFILVAFMGLGWLQADLLAPQKHLVPWLLAGIMWFTSLKSSFADLWRVFRHPRLILLLLLVLHLVLPIPARLLGSLWFSEHGELLAGLVLAAAIPVGVTSVMWSGIAGGNIALALSALTVDTLLSPLILPATLWVFAGAAVTFDASRLVFDLLLMVVLPAVAGILLHDFSGGMIASRIGWLAGPLSKLALGLVLAINLANSKHAVERLPVPLWQLLLCVFLLVIAGLILSMKAAEWTGQRRSVIVVFAYAGGIRNLSAGIVICMRSFPPLTALPVLLGIFFQQPLAALFHRWWRSRRKSSPETEFQLE